MNSNAIFAAIAVWAGVASATPAFASSRQPQCPAMPPSSDIERSSSGGLSLQVGGFGVGGNRSRSRAEADIMMRQGGFEAWSAAAVMAHSCRVNREVYRNDLIRQRDEFAALRERLLGRQALQSTRNAQAPAANGSTTRGWAFDEMWEPLASRGFMPTNAVYAGVYEGGADVDCQLSRQSGLSDCYVIAEWPSGYGFGAATVRYLRSLRLTAELQQYSWSDRRIRRRVTISQYR